MLEHLYESGNSQVHPVQKGTSSNINHGSHLEQDVDGHSVVVYYSFNKDKGELEDATAKKPKQATHLLSHACLLMAKWRSKSIPSVYAIVVSVAGSTNTKGGDGTDVSPRLRFVPWNPHTLSPKRRSLDYLVS